MNPGIVTLISFILTFGILAYVISWAYSRHLEMDKAQFLLADRKIGFWESSFSIAATWIWAPALFVSAQKAYVDGWLGLFWFVVPNICCLILFSWFAVKIRERFPEGFTLTEFVAEKYSDRVQNVYWFTFIGLTVCAFAVQLLAGGAILSKFLNIPYWLCTIIMAILPLTYSLVFGLRASIITDFVKMIMILVLGSVLIYCMFGQINSSVLLIGVGGKSASFEFFSDRHLTLFLSFGLPVTIGLLSGPFGDQSFWQRAFATKKEVVRSSFIFASLLFGLVPIIMGTVGFIAAGLKLPITNPGLVNLETITAILGATGATTFFFIVMAAITSILDSKMCSISSIAGHDFVKRFNFSFVSMKNSSMICLTVVALIIANLPGLMVLHLFLFYGTLRASTFIPTVMLLIDKPLREDGVFYGILGSLFIGLPVFVYGNLVVSPIWVTAGSLATLLTPLIINAGFRTVRKQ